MPERPLRPCASPGCPALVRRGRYCAVHAAVYDAQRGSAAQRGYGSRWRRYREMYLRQHPLCADPYGVHRTPEPAVVVDHIIPRRAGGDDSEENLQALCKSCHSRKTLDEGGAKSLPPSSAIPCAGLVAAGASYQEGGKEGRDDGETRSDS